MAEPCLCTQAEAEPTCTVTAGAGITIVGNEISAQSALPWTSYTPTMTGLTLGNGISESRYLLVGKTLDVMIALRFGSTSTFTATAWRFGMPAGTVPFLGSTSLASNHVAGLVSMRDTSSPTPWFSGEAILNVDPNPIQIRFGDDVGATNTLVAQGVPFVWTTSDELVIRFRTEVI